MHYPFFINIFETYSRTIGKATYITRNWLVSAASLKWAIVSTWSELSFGSKQLPGTRLCPHVIPSKLRSKLRSLQRLQNSKYLFGFRLRPWASTHKVLRVSETYFGNLTTGMLELLFTFEPFISYSLTENRKGEVSNRKLTTELVELVQPWNLCAGKHKVH